jgi:hypothetical protein
MGYSTDFFGSVEVDKRVDDETYELLMGLSNTRRMKRDPKKLAERLKMTEQEVLDKYGEDCQLWVGDQDNFGQNETPDVVNGNGPPKGQPGLWCKWEMDEDQKTIQWNGAEKFYDYVEWMQYLIDVVLAPKGYVVNGEIEWQGEERDDKGLLCVVNNVVTTKGAVTYYLSKEDEERVCKFINDYLNNPLKEVVDNKLDRIIDDGKKKKK